MKKELLKTFFLSFAAFLVATTTSSVVTTGSIQAKRPQQELACEDIWGLEKLFEQAANTSEDSIPLNAKYQCTSKKNESYARTDNLKIDRTSSSIKRTN